MNKFLSITNELCHPVLAEAITAGYQALYEHRSDIDSFKEEIHLLAGVRDILDKMLDDGDKLKDLCSYEGISEYSTPGNNELPTVSITLANCNSHASYTTGKDVLSIPVSTILLYSGYIDNPNTVDYDTDQLTKNMTPTEVSALFHDALNKAWPNDWDKISLYTLPCTLMHEFRHRFDYKHYPNLSIHKKKTPRKYQELYDKMAPWAKRSYDDLWKEYNGSNMYHHSPEIQRMLNKRRPEITRDVAERYASSPTFSVDAYPIDVKRAIEGFNSDAYWLNNTELNARLQESIPYIIRRIKHLHPGVVQDAGTAGADPYRSRVLATIAAGVMKRVLGIEDWRKEDHPAQYAHLKSLIPPKFAKKFASRCYKLCDRIADVFLCGGDTIDDIADAAVELYDYRDKDATKTTVERLSDEADDASFLKDIVG